MGGTQTDAIGAVAAALRSHDRVAVVGGVGSGRTTAVRQALADLGCAWPVVQGLVSLRNQELGAFAVAVGARLGEPATAIADRVRRRLGEGVVVEDVHNLDPASLDLLGHLPRWVATCRADAADVLDRIGADDVLPLMSLPADAARRAVREALGPVADRTVEQVLAIAGGRHRLLREVTGRGAPRTTLRARLAALVDDQPDDVQEDLALLGAAVAVTLRFGLPLARVPPDLLRAPAATTARGLASESPAGLVATPPALAAVAHDRRPGGPARHRALATAASDPLLVAAHLLLAGDDPRAGLRTAGLVDAVPADTGLAGHAAVLGAAADRYTEDSALAAPTFAAALAAGDVALARRLADRVPDGPTRLADAIAVHTAHPATAETRRRDAAQKGATGWRLEAEADLRCAAVQRDGPNPAGAARLLALLDDPLLDVSRARVAATLTRTFAWLGRDADARRLLRYLQSLSALDVDTDAEVHWLAGRDHRAAAHGTTLAGAWAHVTAGLGRVTAGDDPERAALAWFHRDPRRAATALLRVADDTPEAATRWRCRFGAVLALRAAGDVTGAATLTDTLVPDLERHHAVALLRRLGRAPAATAAPVRDDPLSPREREVLLLAGEGLTSREIASHLGITPATVETHIAAATRKLGAATRLEAIARMAPA